MNPLMYFDGIYLYDVALWYGVFSSPYYPHRNGYAIDLYFDEEALYPFHEGKVIEIKKIETPMNRPDAEKEDYMIIVWLGGSYVAKILHVKPYVRPYEHVYLGDCIGRLIVSGYLFPWSEKHMHLEIRMIYDRYRVRNGLRLSFITMHRKVASMNSTNRVSMKVVDLEKNFVLLKPLSFDTYGFTPLHIDNEFIEGVIPLYGFYSVYSINRGILDLGMVRATIVPTTSETNNRIVDNEGHAYKGIGIYLLRPYIKLVLYPDKTYRLAVGDIVDLDLGDVFEQSISTPM